MHIYMHVCLYTVIKLWGLNELAESEIHILQHTEMYVFTKSVVRCYGYLFI